MQGTFEVAEIERFAPPRGAGEARLLVEVPHGATRRADFEAVRSMLRGELPADLEAFFHVNTDEGAPELARAVGRELARRGVSGRIVRCRVPRTLVDTNRVIDGPVEAGMTAGLPAYVRDEADRALLLELHARYTTVAAEAYAEVCGGGGLAVALHTYAPRAVEVEVDDEVVPALRRAYRRSQYGRWSLRPPLDAITAAPDGAALAPHGLVPLLRRALDRLDLDVAENASYRLHPSTQAYRHAQRWPGSVLCLEVRRDLLGTPWRPFAESRIGPRKIARLARAIAEGLSDFLRSSPTKSS